MSKDGTIEVSSDGLLSLVKEIGKLDAHVQIVIAGIKTLQTEFHNHLKEDGDHHTILEHRLTELETDFHTVKDTVTVNTNEVAKLNLNVEALLKVNQDQVKKKDVVFSNFAHWVVLCVSGAFCAFLGYYLTRILN